MTRRITGLCVAIVCSCVISLGAQSSTATDTQRSGATVASAHDVSVTGCVAKAADGRYMLTNAMVEPMSSTTGTAGSTAGGTATAGATAGGTTAGATVTGGGATAGATTPGGTSAGATTGTANTMSWMLSGGTDLDKHVGHKVQVNGSTTFDTTMNRSTMSGSNTAGATAGTAGATTTGTAGATTGGTTSGTMSSNMANRPSVDVKSLKMISASCP